METNHYALLETATEKYTQLVDYICKLQNGIEVNPESVNKLVHSIYKDEIYLIDRFLAINSLLIIFIRIHIHMLMFILSY